jgi:hypothetical protein
MQLYPIARFLVAVGVAVSAAAASASALVRFDPLPDALPKNPPVVALKPTCSDRSATISLLSRLRASTGGDDPTFRQIDYKGSRYVAFSPTKAGVPLGVLADCLPMYIGTTAAAQKINLLVPGNDVPIGVMIYTPSLGFYGDPRAWTPSKR